MNRSTNPLVETLDRAVARVVEYRMPIIASLALVGIGFGVLTGYRHYQKIGNARAQQDFMAAVKLFESPVDANAKETALDKWENVAKAFEAGYQKNKATSLGAAFLAYQAVALLKLGKHEDPIVLLKNAKSSVSVKDIKESYELKLALVLLESSREDYSADGLAKLQDLALKPTSAVHEQALYQLGLYYWIKQDFDAAKNYWQQFIVKYGNENSVSDLIDKVREKLELLAV